MTKQLPISRRSLRALVILGLVVIMLGFLGVKALLSPHDTSAQPTVSTDAAAFCGNNSHLQTPDYKAGSGQAMALYQRSPITVGTSYTGVYALNVNTTESTLRTAITTVGKNLYDTYSNKKTPAVIGCITRAQETPSGQTCKNKSGEDIPVDTATYHLTVYQASDRKVLASVALPTENNYICPSLAAYDGRAFYRPWEQGTVVTALYPFVK